MKTSELVRIEAPAEVVWDWVANVRDWPSWNRKVRDVVRDRSGPIVAGEIFHAAYQMNPSAQIIQAQVEVQICHRPTHLGFCHTERHGRRARIVGIEFTLNPSVHAVVFQQTVDWSRTGLPRPVQWAIWMICRYGHSRGPGPLDELKRLLESNRAAAA